MSDENKSLGFLSDPNGDQSSGRLMKMGDFIAAVVFTVLTLVAMSVITAFNPSADVQSIGVFGAAVVIAFLGNAAVAENSQKKYGK